MKKTRKTRKDNRTLAERADDFTKILTFKIVSTIRNKIFYPNGLDDFKAQYSRITQGKPLIYSRNNTRCNEQVDFVARYSFTQDDYRKILGYRFENGKYSHISIEDIKPYLPNWLHLQKNFTRHYKSGKHFNVESYWFIDFDVLDNMLKDDRICSTDSDYYSQRQHLYVDKIIFGYKQEKKEKTQMNKQNNAMEYPDEDVDVFNDTTNTTDNRYKYFAKDTTSNETLANVYAKYFNFVSHSKQEEERRVSYLRKLTSMVVNRSKRSKKDWDELSRFLINDNIVLETIK